MRLCATSWTRRPSAGFLAVGGSRRRTCRPAVAPCGPVSRTIPLPPSVVITGRSEERPAAVSFAMTDSTDRFGFETRAIHAARSLIRTPIYDRAELPDLDLRPDVSAGCGRVLRVLPHRHPTQTGLRGAASLECGRHALAFASGWPVDITLRTLVRPVTTSSRTRTTRTFRLVTGPQPVGVEHTPCNLSDVDAVAPRFAQPKVIWVETPDNPCWASRQTRSRIAHEPRRGSW